MGWSGTRNMTVQGRAMSIMGSGINLYYQRDCGAENRNPQIKSTSSSTSVSTKGWTWWNEERAQTNPPPTKKTIKTSWSCWICACVCTCVHEAVREEVDTGSMQPPAVISQQTICMCVRVVGITTWGFLTFCLQLWMVPETGALWPLHYDHWEMGVGGWGGLHVSERERRVHPVLNTTGLLDDIHFQASSVLAMVTVKQQDMGKQNPEWRKSTETITLSMCLQSVDFWTTGRLANVTFHPNNTVKTIYM